MSIAIIILVCVLLLLSYIFDITTSRTKIPAVILLLVTGWIFGTICDLVGIKLPNLDILLPVLGNIGLVLIVLEGVLEIKLKRDKLMLILKSILLSLLPIIIFTLIFTLFLKIYEDRPFNILILNAIPISVISSAIVIPSIKDRNEYVREFLTYESSLSDIFGILFFNILHLSNRPDVSLILNISLSLLIVFLVSIFATIFLSRLLHSVEHSVKFTPILILIILIYTILKYYHFPALIFILIFGLILNNIENFESTALKKVLDTQRVVEELRRFKDIIYEGTFLIKSFFFILFGLSIKISEILSLVSIFVSFGSIILIYLIRYSSLYILRLPIKEMFAVAPRGLITILLFLSIPEEYRVSIVDKAVIIWVILISIIVMTIFNVIFENAKRKPESM